MRKIDKANLRKSYGIRVQLGIIITLFAFIAAFKVDTGTKLIETYDVVEQETVKMEQIEQTVQTKTPPPPPRPQVPIAVPNDELEDDQPIDINSDLSLDEPLRLPPPPMKEDKKEEEEEVFPFYSIEQQPELIGGIGSIYKHIKYPELAKKAGIEGIVVVEFVVNKKGGIEDAQVIRTIGGGCDEEALQAVKKAKFKPGMQRGIPVKVKFSLSIRFKLQS